VNRDERSDGHKETKQHHKRTEWAKETRADGLLPRHRCLAISELLLALLKRLLGSNFHGAKHTFSREGALLVASHFVDACRSSVASDYQAGRRLQAEIDNFGLAYGPGDINELGFHRLTKISHAVREMNLSASAQFILSVCRVAPRTQPRRSLSFGTVLQTVLRRKTDRQLERRSLVQNFVPYHY